MTTIILLLVVSHVLTFIVGLLVFRNNAKAVEPTISGIETKVDEIKKVI